MICKKCNGKGYFPEYMHELNDGRCWSCAGTGKVESSPTKTKRKPKPKIDRELVRKNRQLENYKKLLSDYADRPHLVEYEMISKLVSELESEITKKIKQVF